jgi:K+-dependent Na+/Ca+ exchanger-like protein
VESSSTFSYHALLGADQCRPEAWEKTWGVAVSICLLIYLCIILTRVCDQYLIPSLEVLSAKWGLSEDVAGVTLLAFGGSFPELAIHTIATLEGSEIGVGTVIGSAVFNVTFGLAVVSCLTPFPVQLFMRPLIRDSVVYLLCLSLILIFFNWNARVMWWQAALMLILYIAFVVGLILKYQQETATGVFSPEVMSPRTARGHDAVPDHVAIEDKLVSSSSSPDGSPSDSSSVSVIDDNAPVLDGAAGQQENGNSRHSRRNSLARRRGDGTDDGSDDEASHEQAGLLSRSNGNSSSSSAPAAAAIAAAAERTIVLHDYSDDPNPNFLLKCYYVVNKPTDALNRAVIPNCTKPGQSKYYLRSFILSLLVVLVISFTLMCIVQYMGCVSGIDHAVTGLLVLGVAASLPDIISVGVSARRGLGVMAVSGLVGSNVFDVLVGLGFPWLLHMAIKSSTFVPLTSGKVYIGAILACVSVAVFGMSIIINGMKLQKHVAWLPALMYAVYIICVVQKVADPPEDAPKDL